MNSLEEKDYKAFIEHYKKATGIDLNLYKEKQMKRRFKTLRDKLGFDSFDALAVAMVQDEDIKQQFLEKMTINVSEFYRNKERWDYLGQHILPEMYKDRQRPLRIWSAACSTGEEPYTIAMIMKKQRIRANILATDVDATVLAAARKAIYKPHVIKQVPKEELDAYFVESANFWELSTSALPQVEFRLHDLLKDSYPSQQDLIICRNVCIYFTEEAKDGVYQRFADALTKGGLLFVGSTEQIFRPERYGFKHEGHFFYRKL
ncbi:CheR family methyltransferase [Litoribacterium kuwaitense]|uniref:CheR family methyltransferase n=1 Tax=Litoribacterium kuwaitense TaxID=1398745 RepID=UPI0028AA2D4D|nr:protein-glutamate O-methyltransferase CheR [Litoribacterium kuwaitense]